MEIDKEQNFGTGGVPQHPDFGRLEGPTLTRELVIDTMAWGKASHYLGDLGEYIGPSDLDATDEYETILGPVVRSQFERIGLPTHQYVSLGNTRWRACVVPSWEEVVEVQGRLRRAWMQCSLAMETLAMSIAGNVEERVPENAASGRALQATQVTWGCPISRLLSNHFERALKAGRIHMEYDARYLPSSQKEATTLMDEYPLLITQFRNAVVAMIGPEGEAFASERRLLAEGIHALRQCKASTVAFLAKLTVAHHARGGKYAKSEGIPANDFRFETK